MNSFELTNLGKKQRYDNALAKLLNKNKIEIVGLGTMCLRNVHNAFTFDEKDEKNSAKEWLLEQLNEEQEISL